MATLSEKIRSSFNPAPLTGPADSFELARTRVERDFLLLTDAETMKLAGLLKNEEASPRQREAAYAALHRATAPIALATAVREAHRFETFETAQAAAELALWTTVRRWEPTRGMKLNRFIALTLPVELERERRASAVIDRVSWSEIALKAAIHDITETGRNRPFLNLYSDTEGTAVTVKGKRSLTFPVAATVQYIDTPHGRAIAGPLAQDSKDELNPLYAWTTHTKVNTRKVFTDRTRNWPRKQARSKTGYKLTELQDHHAAFTDSTFGTKLTSRLMRARVFHKPYRPIREDEITPRMIQAVMRRDRLKKAQKLDEATWSIPRIAALLETLHTVTSYDIALTDDEGDETSLLEFIAAPERDDDLPEIDTIHENGEEYDVIKPRFNEDELNDAAYITERLQASGLWELAMNLPLDKFIRAHDAGRPGFCTLCSRYGIRVSHALQIVKVIQASLR